MNFLNIFFTQKRVGLKGRIFTIYKFRTMYIGADGDQRKYRNLNEGTFPGFKIRDDPRFTQFGKWLSFTGLDEIPQILNIIKRDMNFLGPRPLPVREAKKLPYKWRKNREKIKPGIISSWALEGNHNLSSLQWENLDKRDVENLHKISYRCHLYWKTIVFLIRQLVYIFPLLSFSISNN